MYQVFEGGTMNKNNQYCYRCKHLDRYYTKELKKFSETPLGWCRQNCETVSVKHRCDKFSYKIPKKIPSVYLKLCLNDLFTGISEIRNVIEAEKNENENL